MTTDKGFRMFQCNSKHVDRSFCTFIYGDYEERLSTYVTHMRFHIEGTPPDDWNKGIYTQLRKDLLKYEVANKMIGVPVYRVKHELEIWEIIRKTVSDYNILYLEP